MSVTAPKRSEAIVVRLSVEEKKRLVRAAIARDQRFGQLARIFINERLTAEEAETLCHRSADDDHE